MTATEILHLILLLASRSSAIIAVFKQLRDGKPITDEQRLKAKEAMDSAVARWDALGGS